MRDLVQRVKARGQATVATAADASRDHPLVQRWVDVVFGVIAKQSQYRLSLDAAGAAFWLVIAVFPATIAMITLFGLVTDPSEIADDVADFSRRAPNSLGAALATEAQQAAASAATTLSIGLVSSLLATLWSVSSGGYAMFRAMRQAYDLPPQSYLLARARAFAAAIVAVIGLGLAVGAGALLFSRIDRLQGVERDAVLVLAGIVVLVIFMAVVAASFRYSIAQSTPLRSLLPGAVMGTAVTAVLAWGVAVFGAYMTDYQAIYGALTGIIVALLAVYTVMYVLLLGAVFNQQLAPLPGQQAPPDVTEKLAQGEM